MPRFPLFKLRYNLLQLVSKREGLRDFSRCAGFAAGYNQLVEERHSLNKVRHIKY